MASLLSPPLHVSAYGRSDGYPPHKLSPQTLQYLRYVAAHPDDVCILETEDNHFELWGDKAQNISKENGIELTYRRGYAFIQWHMLHSIDVFGHGDVVIIRPLCGLKSDQA